MKNIFLLLCLASSVSIAQDFWQQAHGSCAGSISSVAINSTNGTIYVGSDMGLWRTTNIGVNWTAITSGLTNTSINTIAVAPNGNVIVGTSGYPDGGIFISTDNGTSWAKKNGDLVNPSIYSSAVNSSGHIFLGLSGGVGKNGIFRSTDNGTSWTMVNPTLANSYPTAKTVAIKSNGDIYLGMSGDGVFRSTDNGNTWKQINDGLTSAIANSFIFNSKNDVFVGTTYSGVFRLSGTDTTWVATNNGLTSLAVNDFAINSGDTLYAGTSGAWVFRSIDNGANWTPAMYSNSNAISLEAYKNQVIVGNGKGSGGSSGNTVRASINNGSWLKINDAIRDLSVGVLASRNNDVYAGFSFQSLDNGISWKDIGPSYTSSPRGLVIASNGTVFIGSTGINSTTDGGKTWTTNATITSPTTMAIKPNDNIFAGTKNSGVYRTTDLGVTWVQKNSASMATKQIYSIAFSPAGDIFAAANDSIYKSTDNGETWVGMKVDPNQMANAIAVNDSSYIFAGTVNGVYVSKDYGKTWTIKRTGMSSNYNISCFAINTSGVVFAGGLFGVGMYKTTNNGEVWTRITKGLKDSSVSNITTTTNGYVYITTEKGIFRSTSITTSVKENNRSEIPNDFSLSQNYPNPFNPSTTINYQLAMNSYATLKVYDILGKEIATLVNENLSLGKYSVNFNASNLSSGMYFYRLSAGSPSGHAGNFVETKRMMILK